MLTVSFEEASKCPRCDNAGEQNALVRNVKDGKLYTFTCRNSACSWFETDWVVQRLEDGTVPLRETTRERTFAPIPGMTQEKAIKALKQTADDEERGLRGR